MKTLYYQFQKVAFGCLVAAYFGLVAAAQAAPPALQASAVTQINTLRQIHASRTAVQQKIGSRIYLGLLNKRHDSRLTALPDFRFVQPDADGLIAVDISLHNAANVKSAVDQLEHLGATIQSTSYRYRTIRARARLEDLEGIAGLSTVRSVRKAVPAMTHAINVSEGDKTHGADPARATFGTNGTGVKVCVLSDGVDSLAALQASGDLPPAVDVLSGQAGSGNEGAAMLEIIHDLAPGATLGFATADPTEAQFAQNILNLASAGCGIIVDDIIYLDESPFQDGPVAQAVNAVTAAGVLYFSSAGNEGNKDDGSSGTWEGDFKGNGTIATLAGGGTAHDFGDGGQSILVTANSAVTVLTWAENYNGAAGTGDASTDFDLYDMDGSLSTVFDASTNTQDGSGGDDLAVEISGPAFAGERLVVLRFAAGTTSSVPMFNLIAFRGRLDSAWATTGATRGHSAAAAAFSVAATPAAAAFGAGNPSGPYPGLFTGANVSELFTSDGPRRLILDPTGAELCPGNRTSSCANGLRQKPDITAADGVSCAAPGFNPFFGTSAAAPHAAAIAALLKSAVPSLTPAQARTALLGSAIDIETAGIDRDTGAGIVMAQNALQAAGVTPQAFLSAGTPVFTEIVGDSDSFIEANEEWSVVIPLQNSGGAPATAISAVLSTTTAGVTLTSANSTYPDLAVGASANNATTYVFHVGAGLLCGAPIHFVLTASYAGGGLNSPQTFPFTQATGAPGTPTAFSYTGPAVPIPDGGDLSGNNPGAAVQAPVPVSGFTGGVYDVNLSIDGSSCSTTNGSTTVGIDHSFVNDLQITVRSPAGTPVMVIQNTDGGGNNFCQTLLDDQSAGPSIQSVVSANAPFTGSFTPNQPLAGFKGENPNGTWNLQAQDFFSLDTGNIRAFTLTITPAVCNAPPLAAKVSATKSVDGASHAPGGTAIYTVVLTNSGTGTAFDNPGNEFTDVLPAQLTLVSANATSGTALATLATNTVTWNGSIPPGGSVTLTINATVKPGTAGQVVSNQGSGSFDADLNGTNETTYLTDGVPGNGGSDPTRFTVSTVNVSATKSVDGASHAPGGTAIYTVVLTNSGTGTAFDNPGNEFTDVLPAQLTLVSANATSGTALATLATNTVTWNGSIPPGGSVTLTINATVKPGTAGQVVSNQGSGSFDADLNGTNETTYLTDGVPGNGGSDPTRFTVSAGGGGGSGTAKSIPATTPLGIVLLMLMLGTAGLLVARQRS